MVNDMTQAREMIQARAHTQELHFRFVYFVSVFLSIGYYLFRFHVLSGICSCILPLFRFHFVVYHLSGNMQRKRNVNFLAPTVLHTLPL